MTTKLPRYTPVLVADPAPPLPHAAADTAAEAGTGIEIPVAAATAMRDRLEAQDARIAELESAMLDGAILSGLNYMRERDAALTRAEAAEAERDAAQALADHNLHQFERAMMDWQDAQDECRRLGAELAAVRGAMERAAECDCEDKYSRNHCGVCASCIARAALATATPTPPAAEAGTGGGWTRDAPDDWTLWGERWLIIHGNMTPSKCDVFPRDGVPRVLWGSGEYGIEVVKLWGPRVDPPDGWEAAEAERDRLSAELAALRGAWEEVSNAANKIQGWDGARLGDAMEAMDAALATATPTPPAAEAGTGAGWTRDAPTEWGQYWVITDPTDPPCIASFEDDDSPDGGDVWLFHGTGIAFRSSAILLFGPPALPPDGWQSALAALDQPQEADHAAQ